MFVQCKQSVFPINISISNTAVAFLLNRLFHARVCVPQYRCMQNKMDENYVVTAYKDSIHYLTERGKDYNLQRVPKS